MHINDSVALVTGANRGLGRAWCEALLAAGARKVYAAARNGASVTLAGVIPVELDVTDPAQVARAVQQCGDVTLLVNNAGVLRGGDLLSAPGLLAAREELDINLFGPLAMCTAFAPVLAGNGGGAILNVLSVLSWISLPGSASYSISKAAAWAMTNGLRLALHEQGTLVTALHVGFMDTDMTRGLDVPKTAPSEVARLGLAAIEAGESEVLGDDFSRQVRQGLSAHPAVYLNLPS